MDIALSIERSVGAAVAHHLEAELRGRGLLLTAGDLAAVHQRVVNLGARLRGRVLRRCYPMGDGEAVIDFKSADTSKRLDAALAFGAVTARVLGGRDGSAASGRLLCATFNLGIGMVDSLCDNEPAIGMGLVDLLATTNLPLAAERPRIPGWLRRTLPPTLSRHPTVRFTVDIIELFLQALHEVHPGRSGARRRRHIGRQLDEALEAEIRSVTRSAEGATRDQLIEYSRLTSVLPFRIMECLAGGGTGPGRTAGDHIGEALWLIDDLVDICEDARCGALNGILLAATRDSGDAVARDRLAVLARLLVSQDLALAAADAAERLAAGLRPAEADRRGIASFLYFVHQHAGITTRRGS